MRSKFLIFPIFSVFLVGVVPAQDQSSTVPTGSPIPCYSRSFSIPFEIRREGVADPPKEVELLYSSDRGVRWFSSGRVSVDVRKFDFTAPSDGEYWFVFRTITLSGLIRAANQSGPQLRVLVDTSPQGMTVPATLTTSSSDTVGQSALRRPEELPLPSAREAVAVPIVPPKPPRMQTRSEVPKKLPVVEEPMISPKVRSLPLLFSPDGEAVPPPPETPERPTLDPLLTEMSRFYDSPSGNSGPESPSSASRPTTPEPLLTNPEPSDPEWGSITGVSLADVQKQPRVIVRWNGGDATWQTAYTDVLRGSTPQGPWLPIATNQPNSGEYWWFVTNEDTKPFYVSVRLRLPFGASTTDTTRSPIRIDPTVFNSAASTSVRSN